MDVGNIQYNIEVDSSGVVKSIVEVDRMAEKMDDAGKSTDALAEKMKKGGKESEEFAKKNNKTGESMKNTGNMARQMGFQFQDAVVQFQGGANAALIFSQQGSQLLSVIHPLLGLGAALAGVFGGALYNALTNSSTATEELAENIKKLHKEYQDLDVFQKQYLVNLEVDKQKAARDEIAKTQVQINKLTQEYERLSVVQGKKSYVSTIATGGVFTTQATTKDVEEAERNLTAARAAMSHQNDLLSESEKEIQRIRGQQVEDTAKLAKDSQDLIKKLKGETEEYGLKGKALAEYTANKLKAVGATRDEIISLVTLSEKQKQETKDKKESEINLKKLANEKTQETKRLENEEKRRAESIKNLTSRMQEEVELFDISSRYLKTVFEIKSGLIKVNGGLEGSEAQLLLTTAKRLDQMVEEKDLAEQLDAEGDRARKKLKENTKKLTQFSEDAAERINGAFANAWVGLLEGSTNVFDGIKKAFNQTIAEMAHAAITKPIMLNIQQSMMSGATTAAQGAGGGSGGTGAAGQLGGLVGVGGIYAAAAVAVVAAVGIWNKKQDEKFVKMTAEYKQANQSMSAILGAGNKKSETIANSIDLLKGVSENALGVNYEMLDTLRDIRTGIGQTAAGFAKTLIGGGNAAAIGVTEGTQTNSVLDKSIKESNRLIADVFSGGGTMVLDKLLGNLGTNFFSSISNSISKALFNEKTKIIDSGIKIFGGSLKDIVDGGIIQAQAYADIKTTKKVIGINAGTKVRRTTEDLNEVFEAQISEVFADAGQALKIASSAFGINFDSYINDLKIKSQDLSLKGLEGDALAKEIESFFGSTMDNWAGVLLGGTNVLQDFQLVGESAFDTMIRLSTETNSFADYVKRLGLNMHSTGLDAVYATQALADASGGFESLADSLATYYDKFFSAEEKLAAAGDSIKTYFEGVGAAVPKTTQDFKNLISGLDLTNEAQSKQFAALIKVSGAVYDYIDAIEDAQEAIKKQKIELAEGSLSTLGRAVNAQKKIIDGQITAMSEALTASKSVYSALSSTLNGLVISSARTQEATRKQAQADLSGMLQSAQAGKLPNIDDLNKALSVISQPSENLFGTFQEYAADFYATANTIKQLQDLTGEQVTTDEKALAVLESQSTALDDLLVWGKMQVDILNGIDVSVISVADAIRAFSNAVGVELPADQDKKMMELAEKSNALKIQTPQQQELAAAAQKEAELKQKQESEFREFMKASQIAVADNTDKIKKILDKFDTIGMPPERAS